MTSLFTVRIVTVKTVVESTLTEATVGLAATPWTDVLAETVVHRAARATPDTRAPVSTTKGVAHQLVGDPLRVRSGDQWE